jgi:hypothetical protein
MLSCDIFTINVFYFGKIHFKTPIIEIHRVFKNFKILIPHVSTILASLGEFKKKAYKD